MARKLFGVQLSPLCSQGVRGAGLWGHPLQSSKLYLLEGASLCLLVCEEVHVWPDCTASSGEYPLAFLQEP